MHGYFVETLPLKKAQTGVELSSIVEGAIFLAVLPVLDPAGKGAGVVPTSLVGTFLAEHRRTIASRLEDVKKTVPGEVKVLSYAEGKVRSSHPSSPSHLILSYP